MRTDERPALSVTLAEVRAWAEAQPAGAVVGTAVAANDCPLAHAVAGVLTPRLGTPSNVSVWTQILWAPSAGGVDGDGGEDEGEGGDEQTPEPHNREVVCDFGPVRIADRLDTEARATNVFAVTRERFLAALDAYADRFAPLPLGTYHQHARAAGGVVTF